MHKRVTITDVAREAGVSLMTVSRAINDKDGINAATKAQILMIAAEMGFRPSGIARGLATKRTATIGLVVPDIANPFFSQIARGVEDMAYTHDYHVFLLNTDEHIEREVAALDSLWDKQVDGIILCSSRLEQSYLVERLDQFQYVVLINRELETAVAGVSTINIDDAAGVSLAMDHLINSGHQTIAFIGGPQQSSSRQKRLAGYRTSLHKNNLPLREELIISCEPSTDSGFQAATELLRKYAEVTAVFAYNDLVAVGILQACQQLNRRVPQDIAIIGADDIPLASLITPTLSTLRAGKYEMGTLAMEKLLNLINNTANNPPTETTIQPQLILRESTA